MKELPVVTEWAELVAEYYRALAREQLPQELVEKLVVGWQEHMLFLVEAKEVESEK